MGGGQWGGYLLLLQLELCVFTSKKSGPHWDKSANKVLAKNRLSPRRVAVGTKISGTCANPRACVCVWGGVQ